MLAHLKRMKDQSPASPWQAHCTGTWQSSRARWRRSRPRCPWSPGWRFPDTSPWRRLEVWMNSKSFKGDLLSLPPALSEQVGWVGGGVGGEARQRWLPQQAEQVRIHLGQLLLHNEAFWGLWVQDVSYLRNLANPSILRFPQHMLQFFWSAWIEEHINGRQSFCDFFRNLSFIF